MDSIAASLSGSKSTLAISAAASSQLFFGSIWYEAFRSPDSKILYMNSCGKKRSPAYPRAPILSALHSRSAASPPSLECRYPDAVHMSVQSAASSAGVRSR